MFVIKFRANAKSASSKDGELPIISAAQLPRCIAQEISLKLGVQHPWVAESTDSTYTYVFKDNVLKKFYSRLTFLVNSTTQLLPTVAHLAHF